MSQVQESFSRPFPNSLLWFQLEKVQRQYFHSQHGLRPVVKSLTYYYGL